MRGLDPEGAKQAGKTLERKRRRREEREREGKRGKRQRSPLRKVIGSIRDAKLHSHEPIHVSLQVCGRLFIKIAMNMQKKGLLIIITYSLLMQSRFRFIGLFWLITDCN